MTPVRHLFALAVLAIAGLAAVWTSGCLASAPAVPVPPRHLAGLTILVRDDPKIIAKDPVCRKKIEDRDAGPSFRREMESALMQAGFAVVRAADVPHDLEMEMTLELIGASDRARSLYHLRLLDEGDVVAETLWEWPRGVIVAWSQVDAYAARNTLAVMYDSKDLTQFARGRARVEGATPTAAASAATNSRPPAVHVRSGERRVALVIGNAAYREGRLLNPRNDARAMAIALRQLGFEVTERSDLDHKEMMLAIRSFGRALRHGGVGLFYFAGHGVQVKGTNYLIPVGAHIPSEEHVDVESVPLGAVLAEIAGAGNRLNLVVLDACRNNPFARRYRSVTRGLALIDAPQGTLIAYSTAPGSVADDGTGEHGAYTEALVRHLQTPGVQVESVFKAVRRDVQTATEGRQIPWEASSLTGDFYFVPKSPRSK